jgi:hypothetical protein
LHCKPSFQIIFEYADCKKLSQNKNRRTCYPIKNKIGKLKKINTEQQILKDVAGLIEQSKQHIAQTVNATLAILYWKIGKRINAEVLQNKRAGYGNQIVASVSRQLVESYGKGFAEKSIRRMMQFAEVFSDEQIVVSLIRQLSWSHFILLLPLKQPIQREFYGGMCRVEKWSVRTLREKMTVCFMSVEEKAIETVIKQAELLTNNTLSEK